MIFVSGTRLVAKLERGGCLVKKLKRSGSSVVLPGCDAQLPEFSFDDVDGGVCWRSPRDFRVVADTHGDVGLCLNADQSSSRGITVVITQRPAQSFTAMHWTTAMPKFAARLDDPIAEALMISFLMVMRQKRNCGLSQ